MLKTPKCEDISVRSSRMTTRPKSNSLVLTSIRKFSEDPRLRPFLSSHFDAQAYTKGVISDGKSEDCFAEISASIDEVNEEIKGYISAHHENLMGGMQDVAMLASRYNNLSLSAKKIKNNIDHLKEEAFSCHDLIRMRSAELERIHQTSIILRQFRQFMHAKGQLDFYLKSNQNVVENDKDKTASKDSLIINGVSFDIRNLANTAAKLVYELETLIGYSTLCDIKAVSSSSDYIRSIGRQLRESAQTRFLSSIKDRSQASIAACLQIFFHLQCLPEVLLLAIDHVVKETVDASGEMLDLTNLVNEHADLASQNASTSRSSTLSTATLPPITNSAGGNRKTAATQGVTIPYPVTTIIRRGVKDIVNTWSNLMHEQSLQISVLQRVIAKKEDPNTQKKFSDILKLAAAGSSNTLLANGKLLELFWQRLMSSLQDIGNRLVKSQPVAASRIYPYLRRAAVDVTRSLKELSMKDMGRDNAMNQGSLEGMFTMDEVGDASSLHFRTMNDDCTFGSLAWQPYNVLDSISFGSGKNRNLGRQNNMNDESIESSRQRVATVTELLALSSSENNNVNHDQDNDANENGLLLSLKPFRDRYLVGSLSRMNHPVHQMFPEMEGYTAAIPSKRDLQTLIKAIQTELVNAVLEGDFGLVRLVSREALKSLQLIGSKVEDMILNTADVKKISPSNSFAKNHAQDHNSQLIVLLSQLQDAIKKLPDQLIATVISESNSSGLSSSILSSTSAIYLTDNISTSTVDGLLSKDSISQGVISQELLSKEISLVFVSAIGMIDELSAKQLYAPLLDNVLTYIKSVLINIPTKESAPTQSSSVGGVIECSKSVQLLQKQIPELLQSYISQFPKSSLLAAVNEEFCLRVMHLYVTVASLIRPMTESSRLRISQDMSVVEDILVNVATISDSHNNRVVQEFKAFRRLLFTDEKGTGSTASSNSFTSQPPSKSQFLSLPYISQIRPSVLLAYLISCSPAQLPSPYDVSGSNISTYLDQLTSVVEDNTSRDSKSSLVPSIRGLYFTQWKRSKTEQEAWTLIQSCLDTYLQRVSVMDGNQKLIMRQWYELILEIGGHYFDK